ncbi:MAG: DNA alkylation repair protein [Eubacteriales bacterium]|jgi:3-methyladenine DNA glycosylase AlkD
MDILTRLKALAEPEYRAFQCKLMPTVDPARVLGVRTPLVRSLARELTGTPDAESFLRTLPHPTYEENNLHAFLIERERDFDRALALVDAFLPHVDNWATCDSMSPKVFGKHLPELWAHIPLWLGSGDTYTVRFGIGMLMSWYLDAAFTPEALERVAAVRSEEYYVSMMAAWFFATALAKQYDAAIPYLTECRLPVWTHNKTIRKAIESNRISNDTKRYLRTLQIK